LAPCTEGDCLTAGSVSVCIKPCDPNDPTTCNGVGQSCVDLGDGTTPANYCLGGCVMDMDCGANHHCDTSQSTSGQCVLNENCTNTMDDDGDTLVDCEDGDCATDATCSGPIMNACTNAIDISTPGTVMGSTATGGSNTFAQVCPGLFGDVTVGSGMNEKVYKFTAPKDGVVSLKASGATAMDNFDWYVRTTCDDPSSNLGCLSPLGATDSPVRLEVKQGDTLFVFIDANTMDANFSLTTAFQEQKCGDSVVVGTEQCDDGNMNDTDACTNACVLNQTGACMGATNVLVGTTMGDTTNGTNGFVSSCGGSGHEVLYKYTPLVTGMATIKVTSDADLGVSARTSCTGAAMSPNELGCSDTAFGAMGIETITVSTTIATPITIFVDTYATDDPGGPFTLQITQM